MKRNLNKKEIHFSESDAETFVQKAIDLSLGELNKGKAKDIAHNFYQAAHGDPLIFTPAKNLNRHIRELKNYHGYHRS